MRHLRLIALAGLGLGFAVASLAPAAAAESKPWFIPGKPPPPHEVAHPVAPRAPAPVTAGTAGTTPTALELRLPPAPPVPAVPRGLMPPATVVGVLSVPDVLRASTAYQKADKILAERRLQLNKDAQKEQATLRDLGQKLAVDRTTLKPAELRLREKALQDRIATSRREFANRNRIIQEQGQFALAQIQRTLQVVVQKVAASRGMNLVLQRQAVAVNVPEFDLTEEVLQVLNKALPSVVIPPPGVAPLTMHAPAAVDSHPGAKPASGAKPAPAAKPAPH